MMDKKTQFLSLVTQFLFGAYIYECLKLYIERQKLDVFQLPFIHMIFLSGLYEILEVIQNELRIVYISILGPS